MSGVTSSTSIDGDEGMDVEDGDSDAGASKLVSSPGSPVMRRGLNMCQVAKSPSNPSASSFPFLQIPETNLIRFCSPTGTHVNRRQKVKFVQN